ncbi:MAG: CBS domain-containing protein, partial [Candidatus Cloacimonetes bacterium]|nr:CBS domain-containing protein [Candidatus Cloacimonadota bacterium]
DSQGFLVGIITDGDLRRLMTREGDILENTAEDVMGKKPKSITQDSLAVDALNLMEDFKITMLPVADNDGKPIGMLHMHDLIKAGVVS